MRRVSPLLRPSRFWPWAVARLWRMDTIQIGHCAIECALFCYFNRSIAQALIYLNKIKCVPRLKKLRAAIKEMKATEALPIRRLSFLAFSRVILPSQPRPLYQWKPRSSAVKRRLRAMGIRDKPSLQVRLGKTALPNH